MLGFSIGPLLGGTLTHVTSWRVIFWLDVPLMLTAISGLASAGSATARAHGTQSRRADWTGFTLLATTMTGCMALIAIASAIIGAAIAEGWMALLAIGFFVTGAGWPVTGNPGASDGHAGRPEALKRLPRLGRPALPAGMPCPPDSQICCGA
jgi:hypothetical protein